MKIIELNIGLSSKTREELNFVEVLNALNARGFNLIAYRLHDSVCKDGVERCLAVKCEAPSDWQSQLATLSDKLGQDCIAVVGFIGHSPYDAFVPSLWVEPVPDKIKTAQTIEANGFIDYLEGILIPDLRESGYEATAEDFETLIQYYKNK